MADGRFALAFCSLEDCKDKDPAAELLAFGPLGPVQVGVILTLGFICEDVLLSCFVRGRGMDPPTYCRSSSVTPVKWDNSPGQSVGTPSLRLLTYTFLAYLSPSIRRGEDS